MPHQPALSVVVPVFDEEETLPLLAERVRAALAGLASWEVVLVDDGSTDATAEVAAALAAQDARLRLVRLARNYGQTAAMQAGFDHARGRVVVSMDGDLQNDPADIPLLLAKLNEGFDLVVGYRVRRRDRFLTRRLPSLAANRIIRWVTGMPIRDNGCSLKAYRRELLERMHLYSDMHRFIPAVAAATAGARIAEVPVRHHPRRFGRSKYGLSRTLKVLGDLLTIMMIRSFRERPMVMFGIGALGALVLAVGFGVASVVAIVMFREESAEAVVLPGSALLWLATAGYLGMLGLIGEVAVRKAHGDRESDRPVLASGNPWTG